MAHSLWFPWPSTIAGLARSRAGMDPATGKFNLAPAAALAIPVAGPWLARLHDDGNVDEWFIPAPRDCLWQRPADDAKVLERTRLAPVGRRGDERCDPEIGTRELVAAAAKLLRAKPTPGPAFWSWTDLLAWLDAPASQDRQPADFGLPPLIREFRVRVRIDPQRQTAADGMLFGDEGLRFTHGKGNATRRYAVALRCADAGLASRSGIAMLGGERRMSSFRRASREPDAEPPAGVGTRGQRLRVVLLTPAIFENGAVPERIADAKVVAAAVGRPQVISGWDMVRNTEGVERGEKATRRMAPAGSVYWVEVDGNARAWAERTWMTCVSDVKQDQLDGFGLCVVGGL
jgi:CRISPR-associated protein Cmr3